MEIYYTMLYDALFVGFLCGVVGVLVDLDHAIAFFTDRSGRFLHTPLLIVSSTVLCSLIAYLGGLLLE